MKAKFVAQEEISGCLILITILGSVCFCSFEEFDSLKIFFRIDLESFLGQQNQYPILQQWLHRYKYW